MTLSGKLTNIQLSFLTCMPLWNKFSYFVLNHVPACHLIISKSKERVWIITFGVYWRKDLSVFLRARLNTSWYLVTYIILKTCQTYRRALFSTPWFIYSFGRLTSELINRANSSCHESTRKRLSHSIWLMCWQILRSRFIIYTMLFLPLKIKRFLKNIINLHLINDPVLLFEVLKQ